MALLFAGTESRLSALQEILIASLGTTGGMRVVKVLGTAELTDREPFGFHDGISQPIIAEFGSETREGDVVKSGEFVLGYVNEYSQRTERSSSPIPCRGHHEASDCETVG